MRQRITRASQTGLAIAAAMVASGRAAADICVACTGPDASYACSVDTAALPSDDSRLKLLCITELAKAGGHQSCTVSRAVTAPCPGEVKKLAAPGLDAAPHVAPPASSPAPANPPSAVAPVENGEAVTTVPKTTPPPKTVQEAVEDGASGAGDALKKTGEGAADIAESAGGAMQKAGKAVGDAAKSTWKCLSTFFSDC
ncbi:MAG: hypothetical protein ACT4OU_10430 [Hyphomicrobium sp.]